VKATEISGFLWELVRPPRCDCGWVFEQDQTEFHIRERDRRLTVKCGNRQCGKTWVFGAWTSP